jgi:hypothetical protein
MKESESVTPNPSSNCDEQNGMKGIKMGQICILILIETIFVPTSILKYIFIINWIFIS